MSLRVLFVLSLVGWAALVTAAGENETTVYTDKQLFAAICAQTPLIWLGADLSLREQHWPADCDWPVRLRGNMTISGPTDRPIGYTINFNFMARRIVIPPLGEVRLRHFTARNTRRGGGGEIDFIAYSPRGILWTDDLNKNQIICLHSDPKKLEVLPLPVDFPEFDGLTQVVALWDNYCTTSRCWNETLHYDAFFTDVNVGSDSETGGYVMAKHNSSKTCDDFVDDDCMLKLGGEACMQNVIKAFLTDLNATDPDARPPGDGSGSSGNVLAIALPVALGGAALIAAIAVAVWWVRRRRQQAAAAAARAAAKQRDLESSSEDADVEAARGKHGGTGGSHSPASSSRDAGSTDSMGVGMAGGIQASRYQPGMSTIPGTKDSFRYETGGDLGRCLGPMNDGGGLASAPSGSAVSLVEGVMDDGTSCTMEVGPALGQGSFGVVFRGTWQGRLVAVKVILCSKTYVEQVAHEVRLMTSEACRHRNLLRAYACMTKTRIMNRQAPGSQALEATITSLSSKQSSAMSAREVGRTADMAETWIVSEYCDLGALVIHVHAKKFLSEGKRPRMAPILRCLRDIAAGMTHLHSMHVVHGDLKLANVLLASANGSGDASALPQLPSSAISTSDPTTSRSSENNTCNSAMLACLPLPEDMDAKVADFGLSRSLQEGQTHHSTKTVGTVTHMPPELLRNGKLTLAGDVYSFGIIMWEMLTASTPYKGLMYGEVVERVVVSHRRPEFPAHTPQAYQALAERCWAADAAARPTFADVLSELERMVGCTPELQAESDAVAVSTPAPTVTASHNCSALGTGTTGEPSNPYGAATL